MWLGLARRADARPICLPSLEAAHDGRSLKPCQKISFSLLTIETNGVHATQVSAAGEASVPVSPSRFDAPVDVVDPSDRVVGSLPRRKLSSSGANFRVVHILLFNPHGELLLQCIARGLRHEGMWGSSVAGYVLAGESYDQAAARKLENELGVRTPLTSLGKSSMLDGSSEKFIGLFEAVYDGPLTPDPNQISQLVQLPLATLAHERQAGLRAFTPTFLHVLDTYLAARGQP
jgi:isopentenyl-diphosphate Delta-isomerase